MPPYVFISYSRRDYNFVEKLVETLEKHSVNVWWDQNIEGGQWFEKIQEALEKSSHLLLILSEDSMGTLENASSRFIIGGSTTVGVELGMFLSHHKHEHNREIVPIQIKQCHVPTYIAAFQMLFISEDEAFQYDSIFQQKVENLIYSLDLPRRFRKAPQEAGVVQVYNAFPKEVFENYAISSKKIRILQTWIPNTLRYDDLFEEAIKENHADIEILLLNPNSIFAVQRGIDNPNETAGESSTPDQSAISGICENIHRLVALYERLKAEGEGNEAYLQFRLYDALPSTPMYMFDNRALLGFYRVQRMALRTARIEIERKNQVNDYENALWKFLSREFDELWHDDGKITQQSDVLANTPNCMPGQDSHPIEAEIQNVHKEITWIHDRNHKNDITSNIIRSVTRARARVQILQTFLPDADTILNRLRDALDKNPRLHVQVLLLDPDWNGIAEQRERELNMKRKVSKSVPQIIRDNLVALDALKQEFRDRFEFRVYRALPYLASYVCDDKAFFFYYFKTDLAIEGPGFELSNIDQTELGNLVLSEFESRWSDAVKPD